MAEEGKASPRLQSPNQASIQPRSSQSHKSQLQGSTPGCRAPSETQGTNNKTKLGLGYNSVEEVRRENRKEHKLTNEIQNFRVRTVGDYLPLRDGELGRV
jgi:hypothetical protein